ncbi:hypothetical protein K1719_039166 [Acacia pycnantha]|nr:hypothetical protein K1719_039166 [Acacia pycnantha]
MALSLDRIHLKRPGECLMGDEVTKRQRRLIFNDPEETILPDVRGEAGQRGRRRNVRTLKSLIRRHSPANQNLPRVDLSDQWQRNKDCVSRISELFRLLFRIPDAKRRLKSNRVLSGNEFPFSPALSNHRASGNFACKIDY